MNDGTERKADHVLAVEFDSEREAVFLHADLQGLRYLANLLTQLASEIEKDGNQEHIHLMTPEWGGRELASFKSSEDSSISINHLTVMGWVEKTSSS